MGPQHDTWHQVSAAGLWLYECVALMTTSHAACRYIFFDVQSEYVGSLVFSVLSPAVVVHMRCHCNRHLVVAGGVACNQHIRGALQELSEREGITLVLPPPKWCTDNGVMVAWAGLER